MKKSLLIFASVLISAVAFCQTTPSPAQAYKPDMDKPYPITLTANEVSLLASTPDDWKAMQFSEKLTGAQIEQIKTAADATRKKAIAQINEYILADYKKFQADSTRAVQLNLKK